jgi:protein O-GlcNAc transferase
MTQPSPGIGELQGQIDNALAHHRAGRLDDAEVIYRRVLAGAPTDPQHSDALHLLGVLLGQRGQHADAIACINQAIARSPQAALFHNSLGNALRDAGQLAEAVAAYEHALQLNPESGEAWSNLGNALREADRLDESLHAHTQAVRFLPESAEAQNNLGMTFRRRGELPAAIAAFERAVAVRPDYPEALNNLGSARRAVGNVDAALAALLRAARLKRDSAEIFSNLGNVLKDKGRLDDAIAAHLHAVELNPRYASALTNLAIGLFETGRLDQSLQAHAQAIALMPTDSQLASNRLYTLSFHPDITPQQLRTEHEAWAKQFADPLTPQIPALRRRAAAGFSPTRLKIAYISPDFRLHPVGRFMLPLLSHHDKKKFEIFAYAAVRRPDAITAQLQPQCEHWQNTVAMSDADLADQIRRDRIDILVDLTQHMADSRLLVFARHPAPIQVTYLGTLGTTGLTAIDYRLSDKFLDPPFTPFSPLSHSSHLLSSDAAYTEKTLRLPGCYWCYPPPPEAPAIQPLPPGPITFGCLNNFCKISDATLRLWSTILARSPDSRLLLHAHPGVHRQRVLDLFREAGIAGDRIAFTPLTSMEHYFATYHRIHIALDPFPYAGGTTTCDALWMGVPVVTLRGNTAQGRAGVSLLSAVGHPEWIADSADDYVKIATDLATDPARLAGIRHTVREGMLISPLCDAPPFAAQIEDAFETMWRWHLLSLPSSNISH